MVPLEFAPRQSWFLVFRRPAEPPLRRAPNFPSLEVVQELAGPWRVAFDPRWGGPESVVFETLQDWSKRPEEGMRYYSGTVTYRKSFDLPEALRQPDKRLYLDLGRIKHVASVRLNGRALAISLAARCELPTEPGRCGRMPDVRPQQGSGRRAPSSDPPGALAPLTSAQANRPCGTGWLAGRSRSAG